MASGSLTCSTLPHGGGNASRSNGRPSEPVRAGTDRRPWCDGAKGVNMKHLVYLIPAVFVTIASSAAGGQSGRDVGSKFHVVTGVVTAVSPSSLTIGRVPNEMTFVVDAGTRLITTPTGA